MANEKVVFHYQLLAYRSQPVCHLPLHLPQCQNSTLSGSRSSARKLVRRYRLAAVPANSKQLSKALSPDVRRCLSSRLEARKAADGLDSSKSSDDGKQGLLRQHQC